MPDSTTTKLVKGGLLLSAAGLIINILQFFSTIIAAYFLSPENFGVVAIAMTFLAIIMALTNMQLGEALIRQKTPNECIVNTVWTLAVIRGALMAIGFIFLASPIASFYSEPKLEAIFYMLSLSPLLSGLENPKRFILQQELVFRQEFIITVIQKLFSFMSTVAIAIVWESYWALIIGNIAFSASGTFASYILMSYRPRFTLSQYKEIFGFSVWITLGQIVNTLNWRFEYLLIGKLLGMSQLGVYNLGSQVAQVPTAETMRPLKKVIYPGFTKVLNDPTSTQPQIRRTYQRAQSVVTMIALPAGVGFAVLADSIICLVLSERWYPTIFIIQYLSAGIAFQTIGSLVQPLAWANNRTRWLFNRDLWMIVIRLPLIIGALIYWGLPGIVVARVGAGIISTTFNMFLVRRLIDLPVQHQLASNWRSVSSIFLAAGSCILLFSNFDATEASQGVLLLQILIEALSGLTLYIAFILLFWNLAQRPNGPEVEIGSMLKDLYLFFFKKLQRDV